MSAYAAGAEGHKRPQLQRLNESTNAKQCQIDHRYA